MATPNEPRFPFPAAERGGFIQYPTPYSGYIVLVEKVSTEKGGYKTLNPLECPVYNGIDRDKFPTPLYLVNQRYSEDGKWVYRYWCNDRSYRVQDQWNYGIQYSGDEVAYPYYIRNYIVPRDKYIPGAKKSQLKGLLGIMVVNGGSGYSESVTVNISNTNAQAKARVINGVITDIYLTDPGTTLTGIPIVTFTNTGSGTGATAIAIYQNSNAVLVKEEMKPLSSDNPLASRYVLVNQVYETLPGPWIVSQKIDEDGEVVIQKRRHNLDENIEVGESIDSGTWQSISTEPVNGSSFVSWEIVTERSTVGKWSSKTSLDEDGKVVTTKRRVNIAEDIETKETLEDGIWTRVTQDHYPGSELLAIEVQVIREVPGNILYYKDIDKETRLPITIEQQLVPSSYSISTAVGVEEKLQPVSELVSMRFKKTLSSTPSNRTEYKLIDYDFPSLILNVTGDMLVQKDGTCVPYLQVDRTSVKRKKVSARITVSYHTVEPSLADNTVLNPIDIIYDGVFFRFDERYCLTNGFTFSMTTGTGDPDWGYIVETFTIGASTPSVTTYQGWVSNKTWITIGGTIEKWEYGYWRKTVIEVIPQ